MTDHEIIAAMAKAMAKADGVPVESMPPSMTWGGVDYLRTARLQFHGHRVLDPVSVARAVADLGLPTTEEIKKGKRK